jgi:hypothetical protein
LDIFWTRQVSKLSGRKFRGLTEKTRFGAARSFRKKIGYQENVFGLMRHASVVSPDALV